MHKHFKRQRTNYYCGPAVIQMAASVLGKRITQHEAAKLARTTERVGTSLANLVAALRKLGTTVDESQHRTIGDIKRAIKKGEVVIVCFTERHFNWGHYAIVAGFKKNYIELIDPAEKLGTGAPMTVKEFEKRWQDPLHTKSVRWAAFVSQNTARRK